MLLQFVGPVHPANALTLQAWVVGYVGGFAVGALTGADPLFDGLYYAGVLSIGLLVAGFVAAAAFDVYEGVRVVDR